MEEQRVSVFFRGPGDTRHGVSFIPEECNLGQPDFGYRSLPYSRTLGYRPYLYTFTDKDGKNVARFDCRAYEFSADHVPRGTDRVETFDRSSAETPLSRDQLAVVDDLVTKGRTDRKVPRRGGRSVVVDEVVSRLSKQGDCVYRVTEDTEYVPGGCTLVFDVRDEPLRVERFVAHL